MIRVQTRTESAPAHWAPLLINGDASGMHPDDIDEAQSWEACIADDGWRVSGVSDDPWLSSWCTVLFACPTSAMLTYTLTRSVDVGRDACPFVSNTVAPYAWRGFLLRGDTRGMSERDIADARDLQDMLAFDDWYIVAVDGKPYEGTYSALAPRCEIVSYTVERHPD